MGRTEVAGPLVVGQEREEDVARTHGARGLHVDHVSPEAGEHVLAAQARARGRIEDLDDRHPFRETRQEPGALHDAPALVQVAFGDRAIGERRMEEDPLGQEGQRFLFDEQRLRQAGKEIAWQAQAHVAPGEAHQRLEEFLVGDVDRGALRRWRGRGAREAAALGLQAAAAGTGGVPVGGRHAHARIAHASIGRGSASCRAACARRLRAVVVDELRSRDRQRHAARSRACENRGRGDCASRRALALAREA